MKTKRFVAVLGLVSLAAAISAGSAYAQGRSSGQSQGQRQQGQTQERRATDSRETARDRETQADQQEVRERIRDQDIYGRNMMTAEERRQYLERVNAATTDREWARIREEHMNEMRARAQSQSRPLDPPMYGENMMTARERSELRERLENAQSEAERETIREEHRAMMMERARQLGLEAPPGN